MGNGWTSWRGSGIVDQMKSAAYKAVEKTANIVLEASKTQVPFDEGILSKTGVVIMAANKAPQGVICYGGGPGTGRPKIPYAIRWHEHQANFQHGRKRFYLRDPFNKLALRTLKDALKNEMRGFS
jgi:hypothetical protein